MELLRTNGSDYDELKEEMRKALRAMMGLYRFDPKDQETKFKMYYALFKASGIEPRWIMPGLSAWTQTAKGESDYPTAPELLTAARGARLDAEAEEDRPFYEAAFRDAEEKALLPPSKEEQAEIDAEAQRQFDERRKRIDAATRKSKTPEP